MYEVDLMVQSGGGGLEFELGVQCSMLDVRVVCAVRRAAKRVCTSVRNPHSKGISHCIIHCALGPEPASKQARVINIKEVLKLSRPAAATYLTRPLFD